MLSYCVDKHAVNALHSRSEVSVILVVINCVELQTVAAVHKRSELAVGSAIWYSVDVQAMILLQTRSDVEVSLTDSNWLLISHADSEAHDLSEVPVGAVTSYSHSVLQIEIALHTG